MSEDEVTLTVAEMSEDGKDVDPCGENYWCARNIGVNVVAALIFFINLTLIIVLRISPRCRQHVSFSRC